MAMNYHSLQLGRALAAILVLYHHLSGAFASEKYFHSDVFALPFDFGKLGVIYFFVLSGFLITHVHHKDLDQSSRLLPFLKKRAIRIYPNYWLIFALSLIGCSFLSELPRSIDDETILFRSLLLIPLDKSAVGGTGAPLVGVAWTLQYEVFFYTLFGIAILNRKLAVVCIFGLLVCGIFRFFTPLPFPLDFISSPYVASFGFGTLVAIVLRQFAIPQVIALFLLCVCLPVFILVAHTEVEMLVGHNMQILTMSGFGALIMLSLLQLEIDGYSLDGGKLLQFLGNSSYSLYLVHLPLISGLCKASVLFNLTGMGTTADSIVFISQFMICLLAGSVLHLWFERPSIRLLRDRLLESRKPQAANSNVSAG